MPRLTVFTTIKLVLLVSPLLITGRAVSQAPPTATLSASPTSIPHSKPSTLAWTSANATSCSGTGKGFSPPGPSGSVAVAPSHLYASLHRRRRIGRQQSRDGTAAPTLRSADKAATATVYPSATSTPGPPIGSEAAGNTGAIMASREQRYTVHVGLRRQPTRGFSSKSRPTPTAPTLSPARTLVHASGASSTLSRSSTNATAAAEQLSPRISQPHSCFISDYRELTRFSHPLVTNSPTSRSLVLRLIVRIESQRFRQHLPSTRASAPVAAADFCDCASWPCRNSARDPAVHALFGGYDRHISRPGAQYRLDLQEVLLGLTLHRVERRRAPWR